MTVSTEYHFREFLLNTESKHTRSRQFIFHNLFIFREQILQTHHTAFTSLYMPYASKSGGH